MTEPDSKMRFQDADEVEEASRPKPPPGRKPILPRVYEANLDEFEPGEEEEFDRLREPGDESGSDLDLFRHLYSKKTRKQRALECQSRYDDFLRREEEERLRQAEAQKLEDLRYPSILGWFYTSGYYEQYPPFGIRSELVDEFNAMSEEFEENRRKREPETFTEKFRRHFWPPKLLFKDRMFRTRGCYLDFPEVLAHSIADVDLDFEKKAHGIMSNVDATLGGDEEEGQGEGDTKKGKSTKGDVDGTGKGTAPGGGGTGIQIPTGDFNVGWEDYYYDDEQGEFFRKGLGRDIEYYFDGHNSCWRRKRPRKKADDEMTPYDFYFENGEFFPRDKYWGKHTLDIAFDEKIGIWKYDPQISTRLKIQAGIVEGEKGEQNILDKGYKRKQSKTGTQKKLKKRFQAHEDVEGGDKKPKPEDYYFDELDTVWRKKVEAGLDIHLENDENGRRWIRRYEGDWRGLTGNSPDDYYWDEPAGKFNTRGKRMADNYYYSTLDGVWRPKKEPKYPNRNGLSCTEYFFEDGQFKKKEPQSDQLYRRMRYALIYVKRDLPVSGLFPEDFYFDHSNKRWLPRSIRMTMMKAKDEELPWTKGQGKTGKAKPTITIPTRDDWYFDIEEGVFIKKTTDGKNNKDYYFDTQEGVWKSIQLRDKHRLHVFPHDFYFNGKSFLYKDKKAGSDAYTYHESKGIYRAKDEEGHENPSDFYFDYERELWKAKKEGAAGQLDSSGHFVKKFSSRKSPDDFYFDESQGRFVEKEKEAEANYHFISNEGVYKHKGKKGPSMNGLTSRDFYFDDNDSRWKLKILGQDKEYWWDKNNKFFRHIVSLTTRTGLQATDYYFSPHIGTWFPVVNYDPTRGQIKNEKLEWDPLRTYDKPWLKAAPVRYGKKGANNTQGWEGKERIPFDKPLQDGIGARFAAQEEEEESKRKLKLMNVDVYTTTNEEIRSLFPTAIDVEINNADEVAYISFPSEQDALDVQTASAELTLRGKKIKLVRL